MNSRLLTLAAIGLLSCSPGTRERAIELEPCRLDYGVAAECGWFEVFEDREAGTGPKISLRVAVVPALVNEPVADPLFVLVGGPGQSATLSGAPLVRVFSNVRKKRDIVLVDQRGTGRSNPLDCESETVELSDLVRETFEVDKVRECLQKLDASPEHYTTPFAMDDLDDVRAALGYDKINLWGGSYGTRAALIYMRRHPEHVRRVVLDGPAPTDIKLTLYTGRDAQRALNLLFDACAAQPSCARRFPGLPSMVDELLNRLDVEPAALRIRHPRTGKVEEVTFNRDALAGTIRAVLYVPHFTALLPIAVEQALDANWGPMIALLVSIAEGMGRDMADGMFLSVVCAEDVPRITAAEFDEFTANNFLGATSLRFLQQSCAVWPAATLPEAYFDPIRAEHPTLVLSGELDPVVPPSWGELIASRLPNSTHIVVTGASHGVSPLKCITETITEFLDAPNPTVVTAPCAKDNRAPPLFTTFSGAGP